MFYDSAPSSNVVQKTACMHTMYTRRIEARMPVAECRLASQIPSGLRIRDFQPCVCFSHSRRPLAFLHLLLQRGIFWGKKSQFLLLLEEHARASPPPTLTTEYELLFPPAGSPVLKTRSAPGPDRDTFLGPTWLVGSSPPA